MRAWPIVFLLALLGCASVPEEVLPCPDAVAPAENGPWRLVDEGDFTYCVPMEWNRSGRRAWSWGSGDLEWNPGATRVRVTGPFVVGESRPPQPREVREVIGGYVVELQVFEEPGMYRSVARWSSPRDLVFQGGGRTPAAGELARLVYRTVRFPSR